jgi:hypothetical protein
MALTRLLDLTAQFNASSTVAVNIDLSGWDYAVAHIISPTGTVTFNTTNDAGAIEGTTDGNAVSAVNWVAVQGTNLNSGTAVTTLAASGIVRFAVIGKFLQFSASSVTVTKLLVNLFKIS